MDDGDTTSANHSTSEPIVKASRESFRPTRGNPKGHMNAIILRSGKQLDESKVTQGEDGECMVKEKG